MDVSDRSCRVVDRSNSAVVPVLHQNESQGTRLAVPRARLLASPPSPLATHVRLTAGQANPLCSAGLGWRQRIWWHGIEASLGRWCGVDEAVIRM
jgi:hypothetical protein